MWGRPRGDSQQFIFAIMKFLDFVKQGTIMEAEAPTVRVDATPSERRPFLPQHFQFVLACILGGFVVPQNVA